MRSYRYWLSLVVIAGILPAACAGGSPSEGDDRSEAASTSAASEVAGAPGPDPEDVPPDTTDYSKDAGASISDFDYPDDPVPADSSAATLCNLNQEYLRGLHEALESGDAFGTVLVGFSDLVIEWSSLQPHFPESAGDIDRAAELYSLWDEALLNQEAGELTEAEQFLKASDELLSEFPETADPGCFE